MISNRSSSQLMRAYLEDVADAGNLQLLEELAHPDMVDEANLAFGGPPGRDGLIAHIKGFRKNIDQAKLRIHKIIGDDNEVMAWWSFTGVHVGPWLGITPTNKPFQASVFSFFSLRDGRIERYRLWLHAELEPPVTFDSSVALAQLDQPVT